MKEHQNGNISEGSIQQFHQAVADHDTFLGGGAVAAITAAGAASLTRLVLILSARRKANADFRSDILAAVEEIEQLGTAFHLAADEDARALGDLLDAQRQAKATGDRTAYVEALFDAANAPLSNARNCVRLLELIKAHMRRATMFTVSDLGAAAALAFGALEASVMMSEVNLTLLGDEPEPGSINDLGNLENDVARLTRRGSELAQSIKDYTRTTMKRNE